MPRLHRFGILLLVICAASLLMVAIPSVRSGADSKTKSQVAQQSETKANSDEAFRYNTLGVAYMNQQKFAEAQKYFEKALAADPKFAIARLNLGIQRRRFLGGLDAQVRLQQAATPLVLFQRRAALPTAG